MIQIRHRTLKFDHKLSDLLYFTRKLYLHNIKQLHLQLLVTLPLKNILLLNSNNFLPNYLINRNVQLTVKLSITLTASASSRGK